MFKSGTQKGLRDLVQEAGQLIWTTVICEQLQVKTLGRKKEDCRLNTSILQQQTPSNVSLRHQLGSDNGDTNENAPEEKALCRLKLHVLRPYTLYQVPQLLESREGRLELKRKECIRVQREIITFIT